MMMLNDEVNILRQVPLFASIDPSRLKKLAFSSHRQHFVAGEELFHQGDDADHAYIIITGNASVLTDGPNGPTRIAEIPAGNIVGEMCSIGTLLAFTMVCIAVIVLRKTRPDASRGFRVPWVPYVPAAGAVVSPAHRGASQRGPCCWR